MTAKLAGRGFHYGIAKTERRGEKERQGKKEKDTARATKKTKRFRRFLLLVVRF